MLDHHLQRCSTFNHQWWASVDWWGKKSLSLVLVAAVHAGCGQTSFSLGVVDMARCMLGNVRGIVSVRQVYHIWTQGTPPPLWTPDTPPPGPRILAICPPLSGPVGNTHSIVLESSHTTTSSLCHVICYTLRVSRLDWCRYTTKKYTVRFSTLSYRHDMLRYATICYDMVVSLMPHVHLCAHESNEKWRRIKKCVFSNVFNDKLRHATILKRWVRYGKIEHSFNK